MGLKGALFGALKRNAAAISFVIIISLVLMAVGTAYFALAINRAQFENLSEVRDYDNRVDVITRQDEWSRTKFYWANNLSVATMYAATAPSYLSLNSLIANSYTIGMALIFNYHRYGAEVSLAFAGQIFVHGILELTGIFIVAAAALRLAWKIWWVLGNEVGGKHLKATRRRRAAVKQYAVDYVIIFALGALLIILAAPVEAYISPTVGYLFLLSPFLAAAFLAAVAFFYASVARRGFTPMRSAAASVWKEVKDIPAGRWRPVYLPVLTLVLFSLLIWLGLIF